MSRATLDIAGKVHHLLSERGLTVSVAESCTGGLLSHLLTLLPGSSAFFEVGMITYSTGSKENVLGISRRAVSHFGVVSAEMAKTMAEKVRALSKTSFSIATTGNLGPDVLDGKERGLVFIAVSGNFGTVARELRLKGDREENKEEAAIRALEFLLEVVKEG